MTSSSIYLVRERSRHLASYRSRGRNTGIKQYTVKPIYHQTKSTLIRLSQNGTLFKTSLLGRVYKWGGEFNAPGGHGKVLMYSEDVYSLVLRYHFSFLTINHPLLAVAYQVIGVRGCGRGSRPLLRRELWAFRCL